MSKSIAQTNTNRGMLFGLLAVENELITQGQLLAATEAWIADKSRSLPEILVEQEAMTNDKFALLDSMVEKHVELHGGDPAESLAALSQVSTMAKQLQDLGDKDVDCTLSFLATEAFDEESGGIGDPSTLVGGPGGSSATSTGDGFKTDRSNRFRILRGHDKGGLGVVSVAVDSELHREVALKQIRPNLADHRAMKAQFLLEAEITGALEHPNIVPVYGLGQDKFGHPFYAMKFIKGDNLKAAIKQFHETHDPRTDRGAWQLGLQRMLKRFVDVCEAMAYAHKRGILHRDLKPGNIMLGAHGETLVLDWGLARPRHRDEAVATSEEPTLYPPSASGTAPEVPGQPLGTPGFMSPEQARGEVDKLNHYTDIYSLGATLYVLLTGAAPFPANKEISKTDAIREVLERAKVGDFRPAREVNPKVPQALDAICSKAMALEPTARYQSAQALADDIERWMADTPVNAWKEPWYVKAWRHIRQRPKRYTAAAVLTLVTLVGTLIANRLIRAEQLRTEANFQRARTAIESYLLQVSESELLNEEGAQPLRKSLLSSAAEFYEDLLKDYGDRVGPDVAKAHFLLATVLELTGDERSTEEYDRAIEMQTQLLAKQPSATAHADLGRTLNAKGRMLQNSGDSEKPEEIFAVALKHRKRAAELDSTNVEFQRELANGIMNSAQLELAELDHLNEEEASQAKLSGIEALESAQSIREKLIADSTDSNELRRDHAMGLINIGKTHMLQPEPDYQIAEEVLTKAIKELSQIEQQMEEGSEFDELEIRSLLAVGNRSLGDMNFPRYRGEAWDESQLDQATNAYADAEEQVKNLHNRNPSVASYRYDLARIRTQIGHLCLLMLRWNSDGLEPPEKVKLWNKAYQNFGLAVQDLEMLTKRRPNDMELQLNFARASSLFARTLTEGYKYRIGRYFPEAEARLIDVGKILERIPDDEERTLPWRIVRAKADYRRANNLSQEARLLFNDGKKPEAKNKLAEAIALYEIAIESTKDAEGKSEIELAVVCARSLFELADLRSDYREQALELAEKAVEKWIQIFDIDRSYERDMLHADDYLQFRRRKLAESQPADDG